MKKILLIIMLIIPIFVNGEECDYSELNFAKELAQEVNYETDYNKDKETFNITFYNVVDKVFLGFDNNLYFGDKENKVIIKNIKEGKNMKVMVSTSVSNCDSSVLYRYVKIPYYNPYYGSEVCKGHDNIKPCVAEFLDYKNTYSNVVAAINNYNSGIEPKKNNDKVEDISFFVTLVSFVKNNWIKILITIIVSIITISIYNSRYRKIKHGI